MSIDAGAGTVSATVHVALPPLDAFRVFTAEVGSWYVVDEHTVADHERTVDIRFEPHVGGRFMDVHDAATGEGREMGRITAWEPGRRVEFTDDRATHTEIRFEASGAGTVVTIEQRGLDELPPGEADHVRRFGWHLLLGWFAAASSLLAPDPRRSPMSEVAINGLTPYLYYEDAGAALDWLARVFGFEEVVRWVDGDDVVHESEMRVGPATIQLCGHAPGPGHGDGLLVIVHVDDVAAQHARVVAAGVDAPEPEQKPYGPRTFTVTDPWGYRWDFWQHVHDPVEEPGGLRAIRA